MSAFTELDETFGANWTTVLVGWNGLGILSPWPERWTESPPLLSAKEVASYAYRVLDTAVDPAEQALVVELLSQDLSTSQRETIRDILHQLSSLVNSDPATEVRKWRLVLLEQTLRELPKDAVHGLATLSDFWQDFGFPSDSPHVVQGRGNNVSPLEYYREDYFHKLLEAHYTWIQHEKASLDNKKRCQEPFKKG